VDDLLREAEEFARRDPALFLGVAFTLGVLGARFLKSSGRHPSSTGGYRANAPYNSQQERTRALPSAGATSGDRLAQSGLGDSGNGGFAGSGFADSGSTGSGSASGGLAGDSLNAPTDTAYAPTGSPATPAGGTTGGGETQWRNP
jgi:hypothetical protein